MASYFGLECQELLLRVEGKQFDEKQAKGPSRPTQRSPGRSRWKRSLTIRAKPYFAMKERAKADLYRAIATLENLQRPEVRLPRANTKQTR